MRLEVVDPPHRPLHRALGRQGQNSDPADRYRYDPATSYRNAQVAEQRLGDAVLLTFNGWGHPSFQVPSKCLDQARMRRRLLVVAADRDA